MSKHTERAKELRSEVPVSSNCAQTVMRVYAKEIGLDEDLAAAIGSNFGGGMRCGATCGAIAAGYMVLGAKGIESPAVLNEFRKCIAKKRRYDRLCRSFACKCSKGWREKTTL